MNCPKRRRSVLPLVFRGCRPVENGSASCCSHSSTQKKRRGAAMVEMALVLPIFFMVLMGIIEFGRAMMVSQLITNAAREGARLAVIGESTNAQVTQEVRDFLLNAANINSSAVTVDITIDPYSGNPAVSDVSNSSTRDMISINVSVPFTQVSFLPPTYLQNTSLRGSSTMRHE